MRSKESYAVAVRREFTARHFLIGGEWGAENDLHEHHYAVEFRLKGRQLDRHGYLIDIDAVTAALENRSAATGIRRLIPCSNSPVSTRAWSTWPG
jgi:6-pyruvoyl-tetrahydropterin synthase